MAAGTLAEQRAELEAAATIARVLPHLPGARIQASRICPGQLDVSLHDNLGDFEQWREALGIMPETVDQHDLGDGLQSLTAVGRWAGVEVELTGFAPLLTAVA